MLRSAERPHVLAAYAILFDSMMTYFRKWYPALSDQRVRAANALSFLVALNAFSIANVLHVLGFPLLSEATDSIKVVVVLGVALIIANLQFAKWRSSSSNRPYAEEVGVSGVYAVTYLVCSLVAFAASLLALIVFK
jgi:hypothetical protein